MFFIFYLYFALVSISVCLHIRGCLLLMVVLYAVDRSALYKLCYRQSAASGDGAHVPATMGHRHMIMHEKSRELQKKV